MRFQILLPTYFSKHLNMYILELYIILLVRMQIANDTHLLAPPMLCVSKFRARISKILVIPKMAKQSLDQSKKTGDENM